MHLLIGLILYLLIVLSLVVRTRRPIVRTTAVRIKFLGDQTMSAPASGTVNDGQSIFALLVPVQSTGATSNGKISNVTVTLADTSVATAVVKTSVSGVTYIEFDTLKVTPDEGVLVTVTSTVTDFDGSVKTLTSTGQLIIIAGANDSLTAAVNILFSTTEPS